MDFNVKWEIEVPAKTADEAALAAMAIMQDQGSLATVFDVTPAGGKPVRVDLADTLSEIEPVITRRPLEVTSRGTFALAGIGVVDVTVVLEVDNTRSPASAENITTIVLDEELVWSAERDDGVSPAEAVAGIFAKSPSLVLAQARLMAFNRFLNGLGLTDSADLFERASEYLTDHFN